jgi:thioredoxin 2
MDLNSTAALVNAVCPACGTVNRIAEDRAAEALCGKCGQPIFDGHPIEVSDASAERHLTRSDVPVVLDFWAPWCAPCRAMAPVFEAAAQALEPRFRLLKVNTDEEQGLAARFDIRAIPTFVIVRNGKEVARTAGAMQPARFIEWVRAHG